MDNETLCWVWLAQALGPGARGLGPLMRATSAPALWGMDALQRAALGLLTPAQLRRLEQPEPMKRAREIGACCERLGIEMVTPAHAHYPALLCEIDSPPPVLYLRGSLACLQGRPAVAVVGSRRATAYGREVAQRLSSELAAGGAVVVSGLAMGVDGCAHRGALEADGYTIGVLGCGVDIPYPRENAGLKELLAHNGAVLSEYPPGTPPLRHHFPMRNRLISGISHGVLVVEASRRSGSLITVGHALTQNRDVFAVPGNIYAGESQGCLQLLRQGAKLAACAEDILEEYRLLFPGLAAPPASAPAPGQRERPQPPALLNEQQLAVWEALSFEPIGVDALLLQTGLPMPALLSTLTQLELFGVVKVYPGKNFGL